jgi:hypothetical protein
MSMSMKTKWTKLILLTAMAATGLSYAMARTPQAANPGGGGTVIATAGPVVLGSEPTQIPLEGKNLAASLEAITANQRIYLVLRDLNASQQPGVLYHVLLDLPPGAKPEKNDIHFVGTLNFYNAVPLESGPASGGAKIFFSYDLTALIKNLQQRKALSDQTTITILPSQAPSAGAKVSIGRIELVER